MTQSDPNFTFGHRRECFKVDLEKKIFRSNSIFSVEIGIFRQKSLKFGPENQDKRANTTSYYPKFCQLSEYVRIIDVNPAAVLEN